MKHCEQLSWMLADLRSLAQGVIEKEEAMWVSETNLKTFFNNIVEMVAVIDTDVIVIDANKTFYDTLGYTKEEIGSMNVVTIVKESDYDKIKECIFSCLEGNTATCNIQLYKKNGSLLPVEIKLVLSEWNNTPAIFCVARDITERIKYERELELKNIELAAYNEELKATEDELHKRLNELEYNIHLIESMCNNIPDLVWAKDINKKYIFANIAICKKLLCAANTYEPIGKDDLYFAHREQNAHMSNPSWHTFGKLCQSSDDIVLKTEEPGRFIEEGNVKGKYLKLDVTKAPFFLNGKLIGVVGCGRDITKESELEYKNESICNLMESLTDSLTIPVFYKNLSGYFLDCNDAFCKYTNRTRNEILGKKSKELFPDHDYEKYDQALNLNKRNVSFYSEIRYNSEVKTVKIIKALHVVANKEVGIIGCIMMEV